MAYQGWDQEAMRTAGEDAALQDEYIPSSSFTPINRSQPSLLPSPPQTAPSQQSTRGKQSRRRGLGAGTEPSHLEQIAPSSAIAPSSPPPRGRKRGRKTQKGDPTSHNVAPTKAPKQRRVSDGMKITKSGTRKTVRKKDALNASGFIVPEGLPSPSLMMPVDDCNTPQISVVHPNQPQKANTRGRKKTNASTTGLQQITGNICHLETADSASSLLIQDCTLLQSDITASHARNSSQDTLEDDIFDEIFNSIDAENSTNLTTTNDQSQSITKSQPRSSRSSCKYVSPVTPMTKSLFQETVAGSEQPCKPIVRPPFPTSVRDRSPIIGLSPNLLLRTCFRIGEAINQAGHAVKRGQKVIFELYARVLSSHRDEMKQHFVFGDLFHDKPPFVKGNYGAAIWKHVDLYNYDSKRLLKKETMCRCIGELKRDGKDWIMVVHNIWQATWEDIEWVEGIISS